MFSSVVLRQEGVFLFFVRVNLEHRLESLVVRLANDVPIQKIFVINSQL